MALMYEGGYKPSPRVSTPAPFGIPTWDDTPDTAALDAAYNSYYQLANQQPTAAAYTPPPVTNGLSLKPLTQWRDDSLTTKLAREAEKIDAKTQEAATYAGKTLGTILGGAPSTSGESYGQTPRSMIPQGRAGLSAYGVAKSGAANQRGKGVKGLQSEFSTALLGMFADMKRAGLGVPGITDGWRSYAAQVDVKRRKPSLATTPGKSVHGIGMAADLAMNAKQQKWLEANAWRYGIFRLASEPWHVQYWPASKRGT